MKTSKFAFEIIWPLVRHMYNCLYQSQDKLLVQAVLLCVWHWQVRAALPRLLGQTGRQPTVIAKRWLWQFTPWYLHFHIGRNHCPRLKLALQCSWPPLLLAHQDRWKVGAGGPCCLCIKKIRSGCQGIALGKQKLDRTYIYNMQDPIDFYKKTR